jgi:glutamine amidotransferase
MCRLLAYLGVPIGLDRLLYEPEHSLIVQSYQPREMTAGLLNADGFGVGWYHPIRKADPYTYKSLLPIWNDINLPHLSRYVESGCVLANVRSATPGLAIDLSNCQPFQQGNILAIHNGYIENFRQTLYRPLRDSLSDLSYQFIQGTTDSEHIMALILEQCRKMPDLSLSDAVQQAIAQLIQLGQTYGAEFSANLVLSDGQQLVATRFASREPAPSLYWLQQDDRLPNATVIASEPLFAGNWRPVAERTLLIVTHDFHLHTTSL